MADSLKKGISAKYLAPIVVAYAAAAGLLGLDRVTQLQSLLQHAGLAGATGLAMLVLQEVIPKPLKETLVFWRLRDRLPGCRAFSHIAPKDARINPTDLAVLLPAAPMTPAGQNAFWYKWLKAADSDPAIADNHRRFLILRESAVLIALLTAATPLLLLFPHGNRYDVAILFGGALVLYALVAFAARNAGTRLVGNVIAYKVVKS